MKNAVYFGIDGGGTNSHLALIDDEGKIIARSNTGSTNIYSVTKEEVFDNISFMIDSVLETAGIGKDDLTAGCIGSAGLDQEEERILFREFFDTILRPDFPVKLCMDGEILLCGSLNSFEGYCLMAGTGSVALGRSLEGELVRSGGHGYILGDEGSAAWIAKNAIIRILRSQEDRDLKTNMLGDFLFTTGLCKSGDFIHYIHYDADKPKIASLAPLVTVAAQAGDPLALDILHKGAEELALLVKSVLVRSPWIQHKELALVGGVIEHDKILTDKLKDILARDFPELMISSPKGTALQGACMLAIAMKKTL